MSDLVKFDSNALSVAFVRSGFFKDIKDQSQAIVKMQAGAELGIPPMQALTGVHIVQGKPTLSYTLIGALIKKSGRYNYRVSETKDSCTVTFFEGGEQIGVSTFTMADAQTAGLLSNPTWKKFQDTMLFARALTKGARRYCPDIFGGAIYTPDEMDTTITITDEGEPENVPTPEPLALPVANDPDQTRLAQLAELKEKFGGEEKFDAWIEANGDNPDAVAKAHAAKIGANTNG